MRRLVLTAATLLALMIGAAAPAAVSGVTPCDNALEGVGHAQKFVTQAHDAITEHVPCFER